MTSVETISAATSATRIAKARRMARPRRRFGGARGSGAGSAAGCSVGGTGSSITQPPDPVRSSLLNYDEHTAGFDGRARGDGHILHPPGLRGAQLVLHLHGLDHDDGLPHLDGVSGRDE